jgi:5-formyltetrahydrofolate cyclo-ligase
VVGFCWPYKGEFDARCVIRRWRDQGATAALPEVVAKGRPLRFRKWWPGAPMTPGVYEIPVPDGTDIVTPDIALVPMNGFDEQGYRLGYGGGYFDSTLAAFDRRLLAIGISYDLLRLPTIYPQPHDIPMDFVVTELGVYASGDKLTPLDGAQSRSHAARIMAARRLPRCAVLPAAGNELSSPPCYAGEFPGYWGEGSKPGD